MNHYETDDGKIVIDVMKYDVAPLFPLPDGSPSTKATPPARLFRWTFDLAGKANTFHEEQLDDRAGEFPRFDERFCMSDYRHGWIVAGDVIDPKTGEPRAATGSPTTTSRPARARSGGRPGRPLRRAGVRAARPRTRPRATAGC